MVLRSASRRDQPGILLAHDCRSRQKYHNGGHADPTNGRNHALMGDPGPAAGVNGVADARKAVCQRYKEVPT